MSEHIFEQHKYYGGYDKKIGKSDSLELVWIPMEGTRFGELKDTNKDVEFIKIPAKGIITAGVKDYDGTLTKTNHLKIDDNEEKSVANIHLIIENEKITKIGSNGAYVNGEKLEQTDGALTKLKLPYKLKKKDVIQIGQKTNLFVEKLGSTSIDLDKDKKSDEMVPVEEFISQGFSEIIGQDLVKQQMWDFYDIMKTVPLRLKLGQELDKGESFHMTFRGPPGTGKTTMAKLISKMLYKLGVVKTDKYIQIGNPLDLAGAHYGYAAGAVKKLVDDAEGGIIFIDEAYSVNKSPLGAEVVDKLMEYMDPPRAVFIYAGYVDEINEFLKKNAGMKRRIPYHFVFEPYTVSELSTIFQKMAEIKGQKLEVGIESKLHSLISSIPESQRSTQNAGLMMQLLRFAMNARYKRINILDAEKNPALLSMLSISDVEEAFKKAKEMV